MSRAYAPIGMRVDAQMLIAFGRHGLVRAAPADVGAKTS